MAVERKTRLEAIQFADDGTLLVRFKKITQADGEVMKEEWHRAAIPPDTDVQKQMDAVNGHLQQMGFDPEPADELALLKTVAADRHTDAVKRAYRDKMAAAASR